MGEYTWMSSLRIQLRGYPIGLSCSKTITRYTSRNGKTVDFDAVEYVKFILYFDDHSFDDPENERRVIDTLGNRSKEAVKSLHLNRNGWHG